MRKVPSTFRSGLSLLRIPVAAACLSLAVAAPAWAQVYSRRPMTETVTLSGPRFGITMLSQGNVDALAEREIVVRPMITQFGWQFEKQVYVSGSGLSALSEWVPLISGLEQGVALPSLNWLAGVRTPGGAEFGIGPNISPAGVGLVVAAGVTFRSGGLNVPMNFAVTTSKSGARVTILTGFNIRK
jgi:hypothetical protein